jgi:hypothetical protein
MRLGAYSLRLLRPSHPAGRRFKTAASGVEVIPFVGG